MLLRLWRNYFSGLVLVASAAVSTFHLRQGYGGTGLILLILPDYCMPGIPSSFKIIGLSV